MERRFVEPSGASIAIEDYAGALPHITGYAARQLDGDARHRGARSAAHWTPVAFVGN